MNDNSGKQCPVCGTTEAVYGGELRSIKKHISIKAESEAFHKEIKNLKITPHLDWLKRILENGNVA